MKRPSVYILANKRNGTLYVGVTADIARRTQQHRDGNGGVFTRRYHVSRLVHVEFHETMLAAIEREKQIKNWQRAWKLDLIEQANPAWRDLHDDLGGL